MQMIGQKITCPFCFTSFSQQEIQFRCLTLSCTGRALDPVYTNARGPGAPSLLMGRVLSPNKRSFNLGVPRTAECDICKKDSRTRLCPNCHYELSHDVGQIDERIIAIIG